MNSGNAMSAVDFRVIRDWLRALASRLPEGARCAVAFDGSHLHAQIVIPSSNKNGFLMTFDGKDDVDFEADPKALTEEFVKRALAHFGELPAESTR